MPRDSFNREIDYLRISVTDRCNLRCVYCMPLEGLRFLPNSNCCRRAEIERVVRAAVSVGFRKFRLTGGEPTLRARLCSKSSSGSQPSRVSATSPSPPMPC